MLKTRKVKDLPTPVVYGTDDEMRNWAISVLAQHITASTNSKSSITVSGTTQPARITPLPPEAYLVFERLLQSKFLETPVEALIKDLQSINDRLRHLETNVGAKSFGQTQEKKFARAR